MIQILYWCIPIYSICSCRSCAEHMIRDCIINNWSFRINVHLASMIASCSHVELPAAILLAGQLEVEAAKWLDVVQLSFDAWVSLEPKIFQSAWISCGYMSAEDFPPNPAAPPPSIQDAREALDVFGRLGGGTPQRCTRFEWQIKDWPDPLCVFWSHVSVLDWFKKAGTYVELYTHRISKETWLHTQLFTIHEGPC